ncbi:hypothetical protein QNO07_13980 [Streptomyces sp. 549]|uniref:hypothetical protein n=1 Tax=Streptomyces sp. 549 TaxID=3049076 RepID=UPI0024C31E04|nr:hypothetical protein [Streptomyces sp. 549]MDK1474514.1 hypothetical protein [Streptomyces sp. 549]
MAEQQPAEDPITTRIGQAVILHRGGDREEARNRLTVLWGELEHGGGTFHRCAVAHYLAAAQEDAESALRWDRRALAAADALTWEEPGSDPADVVRVRALYPSLHLGLAAAHHRLGEPVAARRELVLARRAVGALPESEHGDGVRAAVDRLERRLASPVPGPVPPRRQLP